MYPMYTDVSQYCNKSPICFAWTLLTALGILVPKWYILLKYHNFIRIRIHGNKLQFIAMQLLYIYMGGFLETNIPYAAQNEMLIHANYSVSQFNSYCASKHLFLLTILLQYIRTSTKRITTPKGPIETVMKSTNKYQILRLHKAYHTIFILIMTSSTKAVTLGDHIVITSTFN